VIMLDAYPAATRAITYQGYKEVRLLINYFLVVYLYLREICLFAFPDGQVKVARNSFQ